MALGPFFVWNQVKRLGFITEFDLDFSQFDLGNSKFERVGRQVKLNSGEHCFTFDRINSCNQTDTVQKFFVTEGQLKVQV